MSDTLPRAPRECAQETRMAMAVKLYQARRLWSGMAAALYPV